MTERGRGTTAEAGFTPYVQEQVGWYVYLLRDPRDGKVFYVGKGTGNRLFAHAKDARNLPDSEKPKIARIRAIHDGGLSVEMEIVRHRLPSEKVAYLVEAAVLDTLRAVGHPVDNEVAGHHTALYGWASAAVVASIYEAAPMPDLTEPVVFFKIQRLWTPAMTEAELYDTTRGWWTVGEKALRARYAFGVSNNVTRSVYAIEYWRERVPGEREYSASDGGRRLGFHGRAAADMEHLLNRSVKHLRWGAGAAFTYLNCDDKEKRRAPLHRGEAAMTMAARERSASATRANPEPGEAR